MLAVDRRPLSVPSHMGFSNTEHASSKRASQDVGSWLEDGSYRLVKPDEECDIFSLLRSSLHCSLDPAHTQEKAVTQGVNTESQGAWEPSSRRTEFPSAGFTPRARCFVFPFSFLSLCLLAPGPNPLCFFLSRFAVIFSCSTSEFFLIVEMGYHRLFSSLQMISVSLCSPGHLSVYILRSLWQTAICKPYP